MGYSAAESFDIIGLQQGYIDSLFIHVQLIFSMKDIPTLTLKFSFKMLIFKSRRYKSAVTDNWIHTRIFFIYLASPLWIFYSMFSFFHTLNMRYLKKQFTVNFIVYLIQHYRLSPLKNSMGHI